MVIKSILWARRFDVLNIRSIGVLFLGLVLISCTERPRPIPIGTDTYWYGNIVSGEKFGINIGDDYNSAAKLLVNDSFRSDGILSCSKNFGKMFECVETQGFGMFRLNHFGKAGSVYLVIENENVVQIVWSLSVFQLL